MPTYQYVCTECGQDLEAVQSFSDAALTECPACSGRLRKRFGAVGVVFKGSGFYRNDSRSATNGKPSGGGEKKADKAESTSAGSGENKSGGKSESGSNAGSSGSGSSGSGSSGSGSGSGSSGAKSSGSGSSSGATSAA